MKVPGWALALGLFGWALALRLLFWQATPDARWAYSALFKGDAVLWLEYARALQVGGAFELGLPLRPPGNAYLLAAVWDGTAAGVPFLRGLFTVMGAAVPAVLFLAAEGPWGRRPALLAGALAAASSGLLVLGSSLNNETPYLLLVLGALGLAPGLGARPRPGRLAAFTVLNAVALLFRAEHILLYGLWLAWLALGWRPQGLRRAAGLLAASLAGLAALVLPWHLSARRAIERFNTRPPVTTPGEEAALGQLESALSGLAWEPAATAEREGLPAFARRHAADFVAATVAHRGGQAVRAGDFGVLTEAFGVRPEPLASRPLVALYGPLNFALANHPRAQGGFSRAALEEPPPLAGGAARYPPALVSGLPPPDLTFVYPPHVALVNHGYAIGWRWLAADPARALALSARKLGIFWSGAATGFGGDNLPLGSSGLRRAVDLVVADGPTAWAWQAVVLGLALVGLWAAPRAPLVPWLLWLGSKLAVTVAFFGYARQGAAVFPVVAVLVAVALDRWTRRRLPDRAALLVLGAAAVVSLVLEAGRLAQHPEIRIDGQLVTTRDPFPPDLHRDQHVEVR